jgi:hypothetical protein
MPSLNSALFATGEVSAQVHALKLDWQSQVVFCYLQQAIFFSPTGEL